MLFFKSKVLVVLNSGSLQIYNMNTEKAVNLEFPKNTSNYMEILSRDELETSIYDFISKLGLEKDKIVIGLGDDLSLDKTIAGDTPDLERVVQEFFDLVPLEGSQVAKKTVEIDKGVYCFATNRQFFELVSGVLQKFECKVEGVIPLNYFLPEKGGKSLEQDEVSGILKDKEGIRTANLLLNAYSDMEVPVSEAVKPVAPTEGNEDMEDSGEPQKSHWLLILITVPIVLGLLGGAYYLYKSRDDMQRKVSSNPEASAVVDAQKEGSGSAQTIEASSSAVSRSDVNIEILNGSGVGGLANRLKAALEGLGYTKIETGNDLKTNEVTTVFFGDKVSDLIKNEITAELEKFFENNPIEGSTSSGELNISIQTGK